MNSKPAVNLQPVSLIVVSPVIGAPALSTSTKVVQLAGRAHEIINITELEPYGFPDFIGKYINPNGHINEYPLVKRWVQSVAQVPATIPALFAYLREARTRNICLIRGAPANLERQPTLRQRAYEVSKSGKDRGDHGFTDEPTKLFFFDVDGAKMKWKEDPEGGVKNIVAQLGEPWASTSFVWFFSATHGLERDERKRWTGKISDGVVRVRLVFLTERALIAGEASALTKIVQARVSFKLDAAITRVVQPNYTRRPHWGGHPDEDVLGDIPTIGYVRGEKEFTAVPDDLTDTARWAKAQGHNVDIADHPDAEAAVRGIGSDGRVRQHLMAAVEHLLRANPAPDVVSFADHSIVIVDELQKMLAQHREEIEANLARHGRLWADVLHYLSGMPDWAHWLLDHPAALNRKTIKLSKEEPEKTDDQTTREAIFARVARAIERARKGEAIDLNPFLVFANEILGTPPPPVLLVAPTGSRKSTLVRANAMQYVTEHPDQTVVILVPLHKLGDEQINMLQQEHPGGSAAVWRGRHADDPETPDPKRPGKYLMKMCRRSEEAKEVEKALLNVEEHLCKQGRGEKAIKCPLYDVCGYQRQKKIAANIWFAAHECIVHEMPKAFGNVGWVIFDESPLDAFMFGIDINDKVELALDALRGPRPPGLDKYDDKALAKGRGDLYRRLDKLKVPIDRHRGAPVPCRDLDMDGFGGLAGWNESAHRMRTLEWEGKVKPDIRPDMSEAQVRKALETAAGNGDVATRAMLWQLVEETLNNHYKRIDEARVSKGNVDATRGMVCGRIQVHRSDKGRMIRMVGLRAIAKDWNVQTLICDATGDAELLRAVWPELETDESVQGWQQLPRPKSVRVFQCVDRSFSKWHIAIESKNEQEMARKIESARKEYAAVLMKALEYGGAEVGVIIYKSTREWIEQNCFVPEWLKLFHHGGIVGTNALQNVHALFEIGRPLASPEDVTRQTEALFGEYISQREYVVRRKRGRIPIVPDAKGHNTIRVDVREHAHPQGQRLKRQICEGAIIQAAGRARAGLRSDDEPLDLHLWTDVPVPELGPVEPVLWSELEAGLDGLMLASGGVWLESIPHAAKAYERLFAVDGLKSGRKARSGCFANKDSLLAEHHTSTSSPTSGRAKGSGRNALSP